MPEFVTYVRYSIAASVTFLLLVPPAAVATGSATSSAHAHGRVIIILPACPGDCDGDNTVTINELITGVNIVLGQTPPEICLALDLNSDGEVTIDELITALTRSLLGCSAESSPIALSATTRAPGEMLTIFHPSIVAGRAVTVTFRGPDRYVLTVSTELTEDGAARIAVPPFIDTTSFRFTAGEVAVSIEGVDSQQSLFITALPTVQAAPGALTVVLLHFGIARLAEALDGVEALEAQTGVDQSRLVAALEGRIDVLAQMADEIETFGELTLGVPGGDAVMGSQALALLDQLVVTAFVGALASAPAGGAATSMGGAAACDITTRAGFADCLEQIKHVAIPGMQVFGSYFSVLTGLVGVVAIPFPPLQPLAGVAAATSVASTLATTLGTALVSLFADLSIDAIRGQDPDVYRAARNAEGVLISGARSVALTFAGAIEWAGTTLVNLVGFGNDTRDGITSLRDHVCATSEPRARQQWLLGARDSKENFCRLTNDGSVPSPTASPTVVPTATPPRPTATRTATRAATATATATRPAATVTRPMLPSATPTRTATPTASAPPPTTTRSPTRSPSPTQTRTAVAARFAVTFFQNTDGSTGTSAAGAQVQLSGAADFPTISWSTSVGDVLQVTALTNPGGLLYGLNSAGNDGEPVPIRSPVHYGDYTIPDTVRLIEFAAPPLVPGTEYVVNVINFRARTASVVFSVR